MASRPSKRRIGATGVKTDKEWEALMAEAPKQRAKFEAMLEANPEL